jgi:hypothetical protein
VGTLNVDLELPAEGSEGQQAGNDGVAARDLGEPVLEIGDMRSRRRELRCLGLCFP